MFFHDGENVDNSMGAHNSVYILFTLVIAWKGQKVNLWRYTYQLNA
jgi:hypothetical protein